MAKLSEQQKNKLIENGKELASKGVKVAEATALSLLPLVGPFLSKIYLRFGNTGLFLAIISPIFCCCGFLVIFLYTVQASKDLGKQIEVGRSLIDAGCATEGLGLLDGLSAADTEFGTCLLEDAAKGENGTFFRRNSEFQKDKENN